MKNFAKVNADFLTTYNASLHKAVERDDEEVDEVIEIEETSVEPVEAIREAVDRVDEEANEIIVEEIIINSITEATINKIARGKAILDKFARGEAARNKTAEEGKAILEATERVDEEVEGPRIESRPR